MNIDGIVISPGPKSPKEAGISMEIIDNFKGELPILGICLGHQCIGQYFNANVRKGKEPVHGKMFYINHNETQDEVIMGIKHKEYEIHGVQFHPEAEMTEAGHSILKNFINITKKKRSK